MSMTRCDECEHLIDSDDDPDCFMGKESVVCKWCREAISDINDSAEVQIERRMDFLCRELDEFCAMAKNAETADLIAAQAIVVGQVLFRAQLILSFLAARKVPTLKMVQNNG